MNISFALKTASAAMLVLFTTQNLAAQVATEAKLLGCWEISRFEFLEPMEDSLDLINGSKGHTICFEKNGKFNAKQVIGKDETPIGTGTYSIDADGKTLHQKRDADDGGIDEPGEVVSVTESQLALKAHNLIMHLRRVSK